MAELTYLLGFISDQINFFKLFTITIILLKFLNPSTSLYNCLTKCECVYSRNKLHADCGAQSLTELPKVSVDISQKV